MMEEFDVDAGGARLHCRARGRRCAPPLVLLHGLTASGAVWETHAFALSRHWRVYAPDARGHGRSDRSESYSFDAHADDLAAFLDALGLDRPVLVGHSMGGVSARLCAHRRPDRVAALVLAETPPPVPVVRPSPSRPDILAAYDWRARVDILRELQSPSSEMRDGLARVTAPTLVVAGGESSPFSQPAMADTAETIPDARLRTIPVGHRVHTDAPGEFLTAVTDFLVGVTRRGTRPPA